MDERTADGWMDKRAQQGRGRMFRELHVCVSAYTFMCKQCIFWNTFDRHLLERERERVYEKEKKTMITTSRRAIRFEC